MKLNVFYFLATIAAISPALSAPANADVWADKPLAKVQELAEHGDTRAEREMCLRYAKALGGVDKDLTQAHAWCAKAAAKEDPVAMRNMGLFYLNGEVVEKDEKRGVEWFQKAADKGEFRAQYNLGVCYYEGRGIARDYAKAVAWYRRASAQGAEKAQRNLAYMLVTGKGTEVDLVEAYTWFDIADRLGEPYAKEDRDKTGRKLNAAQLAQAKAAALAWQPKFEMEYFD